jgi:hypothetical protein
MQEVFRISPKPGYYYETAEYTHKKGTWSEKNEQYFTTNPMRYVGKFIKHITFGFGDSATHIDIFDDNGKEISVYYLYEGTTSFREVSPRTNGTNLLAKTEKSGDKTEKSGDKTEKLGDKTDIEFTNILFSK